MRSMMIAAALLSALASSAWAIANSFSVRCDSPGHAPNNWYFLTRDDGGLSACQSAAKHKAAFPGHNPVVYYLENVGGRKVSLWNCATSAPVR